MKKEYPPYISTLRKPTPAPHKLVVDGQCAFGTFQNPLPVMNLLDCKKPAGKLTPHCFNKFKLTQWEAFEVRMDEGILISAVYNIGIGGFSIFVWSDKRKNKVYSWMFPVAGASKPICAANLINGCKTHLTTAHSDFTITNNFEKGEGEASAKAHNKKGDISFDFSFKTIAPPSVVSIPFGKNSPLYSHKEFFTANGSITINGEKMVANENTTVIIDDHKGYYPHKMHYDWVTTMGKANIDGVPQHLAINFTQNQSIDPAAYNENVLWLNGESCPLPPVQFRHIDSATWEIKDEFGSVNAIFKIENDFSIMAHLGIVDISYYLPFGKISGFVKDNDGKIYNIDGMDAIGEDKSTKL